MIYVDAPTWKKHGGRKLYSHMVADTYEELHAFAAQIGVKPHFFHRAKNKHYDITTEQQQAAVLAGALLVDTRTIIRVARKADESETSPTVNRSPATDQ